MRPGRARRSCRVHRADRPLLGRLLPASCCMWTRIADRAGAAGVGPSYYRERGGAVWVAGDVQGMSPSRQVASHPRRAKDRGPAAWASSQRLVGDLQGANACAPGPAWDGAQGQPIQHRDQALMENPQWRRAHGRIAAAIGSAMVDWLTTGATGLELWTDTRFDRAHCSVATIENRLQACSTGPMCGGWSGRCYDLCGNSQPRSGLQVVLESRIDPKRSATVAFTSGRPGGVVA